MGDNYLSMAGWGPAAPIQGGFGFSAPNFAVPETGLFGGVGDFLKGFSGTKDAPGWGGPLMGGIGALSQAWLGMQQYGLAKQTLAENKRQFNLNYDAQKTTTNSALEDRQRARVASNPGAYQSVGSYMQQNGIK